MGLTTSTTSHKVSGSLHSDLGVIPDLDCEESAYDNYEYESEGCDDPDAADEYENQRYAPWPSYNQSTEYNTYNNPSTYLADSEYCPPDFQPQYQSSECGDTEYYVPGESQACTDMGSTIFSDLMDEYCDQDDSVYDIDTLDECADDCGPPCGDAANQDCPLPDPNVQCPPCDPDYDLCKDQDENEFMGRSKAICGKNLQKINEIIKNITPFTVLDEFMLSVANYTPDNGEVMFDAMSNEVNNFKELIKEIYANRNDNVSELLKTEQRQMKNKYEKKTKELNSKTEETIEAIKELLPNFDLAAFGADPSNYVYSAMMENFKKEKQVADASDFISLNADKNFRVAMHKRTWLMREAERIECDNEERMCKLNEMMAQLACLSDGLATSNKKLAAYNRQLESHATCLRNKLAYNETVLGCLTDEIEINKIEDAKETCGIIEPDDILTPYPSGYDYC